MSLASFKLARAGRAERHLIEALRAFATGDDVSLRSAPIVADALRPLAMEARQAGYAIWPIGATYASADELKLVGWLALLQRERTCWLLDVDVVLADLLKRAATALKSQQQLPYKAVLRAEFAEDQAGLNSDAAPDRLDNKLRTHLPVPRATLAMRDSVRERAVAYARKHGRVSTRDLNAIGLSRQYLSDLCRRGTFVRIRHGLYEASPPPTRPYPAAMTAGHQLQS
jgi:hypothetical protein